MVRRLSAGENKSTVTPATRDSMRESLASFLTHSKRRQLNINMWNDTRNFPGYRDFVLDNKIINTNVVVGENEFQKGTYTDPKTGQEKTRYVKAFAAPIANKVAPKSPEVVTATNNIPSGDPATTIVEKEGASEVEINAEIKKRFPNKKYHQG